MAKRRGGENSSHNHKGITARWQSAHTVGSKWEKNGKREERRRRKKEASESYGGGSGGVRWCHDVVVANGVARTTLKRICAACARAGACSMIVVARAYAGARRVRVCRWHTEIKCILTRTQCAPDERAGRVMTPPTGVFYHMNTFEVRSGHPARVRRVPGAHVCQPCLARLLNLRPRPT